MGVQQKQQISPKIVKIGEMAVFAKIIYDKCQRRYKGAQQKLRFLQFLQKLQKIGEIAVFAKIN